MGQDIRQSQFITTWGPGAILETENGPRIIPLPDIGIFDDDRLDVTDFEITDRNLSEGILGQKRIFQLPTDAQLGVSDDFDLYKTKGFPEWWLCSTHGKLYRKNKGCPQCEEDDDSNKDAIRFVQACPKGHLDDLDWDWLVHRTSDRECTPPYYEWKGAGGSLNDIRVGCPECGNEINFGKTYSYSYDSGLNCSGRYPERESFGRSKSSEQCGEDAVIIQRQSSNLRIPEIKSLFTVDNYTQLHQLLENDAILPHIAQNRPSSKEELEEVLQNAVKYASGVNEGTVNEILSNPWEEIDRAIEDVLDEAETEGYGDLITDEFQNLIKASEEGAPPVERGQPNSRVIFKVPETQIRNNVESNGLSFRVTPVTRLRTVMVQTGYSRINTVQENESVEEQEVEPVSVAFEDKYGHEWVPGTEFLGEGIFLTFDGDNEFINEQEIDGEQWEHWLSKFENNEIDSDYAFRDTEDKEEIHPMFIWWHTLSHLLIRTLSTYAGYSSASIRERVYLERDGDNVRGGIILYTVQPGEGTMGGLVSLTEDFEDLLDKAFNNSHTCPNDPLCSEKQGEVTGSCCYGCLLTSETSCEHRNMWLDRRILEELQ